MTRFSEQIPDPLPDWARHFAYLPFSSVLNRCSAFVHHGGIGSLSQGLRAGVPQLIRPMAFDQFDNGRRAADLNVARVLSVRRYRPAKVAQMLDELGADSIGVACRDVAARFDDSDPLDSAACCVEDCMRYSRQS